MPGRDGTGPMGQGPLTGGGRGPCAVEPNDGDWEPGYGRGGGRGYGRGGGRRYGHGGGRGYGRGAAGGGGRLRRRRMSGFDDSFDLPVNHEVAELREQMKELVRIVGQLQATQAGNSSERPGDDERDNKRPSKQDDTDEVLSAEAEHR